jgi:hypothetical protein
MKVDFFIRFLGLVFWNSIHLEVASDSFCFLINSSWLLVFILYVFFLLDGDRAGILLIVLGY